eukprot:TRINITY_DN11201_c0_g1_i1.p1 TRINITY_DN11201_c0_g1~~TRINITY_DN11201_c0_g1_i1.p1  ORF type:complete len:315 (+),score=23.49 TRINITY_DN11201_c0_g1_i1:65-946(+)
MEAIGRKFKLHPLTIEDIQTTNSREKIEIFEDYLFLIIHAISPLQTCYNELLTTPLKMIVVPKLMLSFHDVPLRPMEIIPTLVSVIPSIAWVVHAVVDSIIDMFVPVVDNAVDEVDAVDDLVFSLSEHEQADLLKRMRGAGRRMAVLRQNLWPKRDILINMIDKHWRKHFLKELRIPYLRDVFDHVVVMLQKLEVAGEMLRSLQSTYMNKVSIQVSESSNAINDEMKRFSSVATIILPLSFFTGLMGMNVTVPGQHNGQDPSLWSLQWFFGILAFLLGFGALLVCYFRKRNWL